MTNKQIFQLAIASYSKDVLDSKKVGIISKKLSRSQLKKYIKNIKKIEKEKTVKVYLPKMKINKIAMELQFRKLFPKQKIVFDIDPSIMVGLKVVNNDLIYEMSLRDTLKRISSYISERSN